MSDWHGFAKRRTSPVAAAARFVQRHVGKPADHLYKKLQLGLRAAI
jgi:hypothetical protein